MAPIDLLHAGLTQTFSLKKKRKSTISFKHNKKKHNKTVFPEHYWDPAIRALVALQYKDAAKYPGRISKEERLNLVIYFL